MIRAAHFLAALALLSSPHGQEAPPSTESLQLIGGLATNVLISSNLNIGLTMELRKAKAADARLVLTIMKQSEAQASTNATQLKAFSKKTRLTDEDRKYLQLLLDGLEGVTGQAAAVREALEKGDSSMREKYNKHRKDTEAIIKRIVEE